MQLPIVPGVEFDAQLLSLIFGAFFLGGLIKGAIGFGLPIVVISLLSMFVPVSFGIALNVIPPSILNIWQAVYKATPIKNLKRFWPLFLGFVFGAFASTTFITGLSPDLILASVGVVILAFCANSVWGITLTVPPEKEKLYGLIAGLIAGVMGGLTSISVPPVIMFLVALGLQKDEFVSVLGLYFITASLCLIAAYSKIGLLDTSFIPLALVCVVVTAAGMWCGQLVRGRLDQKKFYNAVLIVLAIISLNLLRRAIF